MNFLQPLSHNPERYNDQSMKLFEIFRIFEQIVVCVVVVVVVLVE
jgi:hypothetical protein